MKLLRIELRSDNESIYQAFFNQNVIPTEEVTNKIWEKRNEAVFLMMWGVNNKSNKSDGFLLGFLKSHELLAMKSIDDLKSWIQDTKQRTLSF